MCVLQVSSQLEMWAEELQHMDMVNDGSKAEQMLQMHNDSVLHMQNFTFEVLQRGQDLCQVIWQKLMIWKSRKTDVVTCKVTKGSHMRINKEELKEDNDSVKKYSSMTDKQ